MPPTASFRTTVLLLLVGLSATACWLRPAPDAPIEVPPAADLTVADTAAVVFGRDQDRHGFDLSGYLDAQWLGDGRLAVLTRDLTIRVFAADGPYLASYGGKGEGPGRFLRARMRALPGDTLLVYDGFSRRATWIDPAVGVVRSVQLGSDIPFHHSIVVGVADSGAVLLSSLHSWSDARTSIGPDSVRSEAEVVAAYPDGHHRVVHSLRDLLLTPRAPPFGPADVRTLDNVRYGGAAHLVSHAGAIYAIEGGSRRVVVRHATGGVMRQFELAIPRMAVSEQDRERLIEMETAPLRGQNLDGHAPPPDPRAALRFLESAVFADSFPPADGLLLDPEEPALWVIHGRPFDAPRWRASKVSLSGEPLGMLEVELLNSRPVAFRGDRVLLARTDSLGVTWFELREIVGKP